MGWRELPSRRKDVFGYRVEDAWVFSENSNVKNFLRVNETNVLQLRVETCFFGPKVWNTQAGGDLCGLVSASRKLKGSVQHTPAPVSTTMFFDIWRRRTASSIVLYWGSLTRFESSRVMPRPRSGKYL